MNYSDPKIGWVVAGGTTATGSANWLGIIQSHAGTVATCVGILLTLVLIVVHIKRIRHDSQAAELARIKAQLEIDEIRVRLRKTPL